MSTTGVLATVGTVLVALLTLLGGYFARKGDKSVKLTERYFNDAEFNMNLVGALRTDYWTLYRVVHQVVIKHNALITGLPEACPDADSNKMAALMQRVGPIPDVPEPEHLKLEQQHAATRQAAKEG